MTLTSEPLTHLALRLGIPVDELAAVERVDRLAGSFNIDSGDLRSLATEDLDRLIATYGAAVRLTIGTGQLEQFRLESEAYDVNDLTALTDEAAATTSTYQTVIEVDKTVLGEALAEPARHSSIHVFFFGHVLKKMLERTPTAIELELWKEIDRRVVVVVLDTDVHATGNWISFVGGTYADHARNEMRRPLIDDTQEMATRRNNYIGWDSTIDTRLTPAHFRLQPTVIPDWLQDRIDILAAGLGAMYLCDRARDVQESTGHTFTQVEFRGREHVAYMPIHWNTRLSAHRDPAHLNAVLEVVEWCYELRPKNRSTDMLADRLPFVQTRVAQLLEGRDEAGRITAFATAMPAVAEGVQWHWRSFIEGRVNEYLEQVTELERIVDTTVARFSNQTAALTKRLTETMLAAIAALIGSFVASAFARPFQAELFTIGMLVYAGYVLIFPLTVGTAVSVGDVRTAKAAFSAYTANIAKILGDERVDEVVDQRPNNAEHRFIFWAVVVGVLYVIVAAAAIVAALRLPEIIR